MSGIKPINSYEALSRVAAALGFDMQLDPSANRYRFVHGETGYKLHSTWEAPWRHDRTTKRITCQHGKTWGQASPISCERCLDPDSRQADDHAFLQTALTAVEEMWAVATTGTPRPLVS